MFSPLAAAEGRKMCDEATLNAPQQQDDLRMLFQVCVSDLAYLKEQQWRITNYTLLLYAVLFGCARAFSGNLSFPELVVRCFLAFLVLCAAFAVLVSLQRSIDKGRRRMRAVRSQLSEGFKDAWAGGQGPDDRSERKQDLLWLFCGVVLIGFTCLCWLLWRMH